MADIYYPLAEFIVESREDANARLQSSGLVVRKVLGTEFDEDWFDEALVFPPHPVSDFYLKNDIWAVFCSKESKCIATGWYAVETIEEKTVSVYSFYTHPRLIDPALWDADYYAEEAIRISGARERIIDALGADGVFYRKAETTFYGRVAGLVGRLTNVIQRPRRTAP